MNNKKQYEIVNKYKDVAKRMLHLSFPDLYNNELDEAINYSINKRLKNNEVKLYNNYSDKTVKLTLLDLCDYILERKPILTSYGVLFTRKGERPNPFGKLLKTYMDNREINKGKMFTFPPGSEDFERYNLAQLLDKLDSNATYGAAGLYSCILYSLHVAPSITTTGRSCISSAGLVIEAFLSNNVKFGSLNEIITFIDNVIHKEKRKYDDNKILDRNIRKEEVMAQICNTCGFEYIPSQKDLAIIWDIIGNISQSDLNRLYYKNNLYEFMNNKSMTKAIIYLLDKLDLPLVSPNMDDKNIPMKQIEPELEEFESLLAEYVYYPHQYMDRMDRYRLLPRKSCILTDTDSVICSFDGWYRFVLDKIKGKDLKIAHEKISLFTEIKLDEFGDPDPSECIPLFTRDDSYTYDFYDDDLVEEQKALNPTKIIPQEGVKHTIINIMAYCLGHFINNYIEKYTMHSNSWEKGKKCLLYLKNEFLFKRMLLTEVKKHYASIPELREGHVIPEGIEHMDIKGLEMIKGTTNDTTRERLREIMYEDILNSEEIDQVKILKDLAIFEKEIYDSLKKGEKKFYSPRKMKSIRNYANPITTPGVRQMILWNTIRTPDMTPLDLNEGNSIDIVKMNLTPKNLYKLKERNEDAFKKISKLFEEKGFENGVNGIAIPLDSKIPDYLSDFIDYTSIINDNLSLFPIESVGIGKFNKANNYSNIIHI